MQEEELPKKRVSSIDSWVAKQSSTNNAVNENEQNNTVQRGARGGNKSMRKRTTEETNDNIGLFHSSSITPDDKPKSRRSMEMAD